MRRFSFFLLMILAMGAGVFPLSARAQNIPDPVSLSTDQDALFTFYKLTGRELDIPAYVAGSPGFQKLDSVEQRQLLDRLVPDFTETFRTLSPSQSPLRARLPVSIEALPLPLKGLAIKFYKGKVPYLPFQAMGMNLAVIPEDLALYQTIPLEDTLAVQHILGRRTPKMYLYLDLIATQAKADKPVVLDGYPQYIIMSRIARIRLFNASSVPLWSYINPTYQGLFGGRLEDLRLQSAP